MERKHDTCSRPFAPTRNAARKTCAEIVGEARRSLRVQSARRPFTPRDAHRQLFGTSSARAEHDSNRPPSSFSLHAQNFDAPDSRPGSGTRLAPLNHEPKFPVACDATDAFKGVPKPPAEPLDAKRGVAGARARLLRAGSLPTIPPAEKRTDDSGQKQPSAKRLHSADHTAAHCAPHGTSERLKQPGDDSGVRPTDCTTGRRTEPESGVIAASCTGDDVESLTWKNKIGPLLQRLESAAAGSSEGPADSLCDVCDGLHGALAEADMLGRRCKRRSGILRTLFRLVDLNSAQLDLRIAKLCLALCVSGNNLLNICKLVFRISRSESNDVLFLNCSIVDSLLGVLHNEEVSACGEALLYCVGTLKFLSGNGAILRPLLDKNCIAVARGLTRRLHTAEEAHFTMAGHILVQLTATLRNLAEHPDSRSHFVSSGVLSELCLVLHRHRKDRDVCTNISRIYSKLSSYSECRLALAQTPNCYGLFLELLSKHHQKQDLVVRLLFTLVNLTAKMEEARLQLYQCSGCVDTLLRLYDAYQRRGPSPSRSGAPSPGGDPGADDDDDNSDDVLVKLVSVLANMSIHPAVGPALANNAACLQLLMETLELRSMQESEELVVNAAATVNNLSFYQEESAALRHGRLAIAKLMLKLLLSSRADAMLEATRVYGNMSLSKDVRDFIMQNKVHRFVVTLLDSKSTDVCFSACGVLTNLAMDPPNRVSLLLEGASAKLLDCLRDFGPGDWQLAGQVCQALWNLIAGGPEELLDTRERESLLDTLAAYLDEEEALTWTDNEDMRDYQRACWESEFLPVAQKLLRTLQTPE